jgi:plasmid stability protein
MVRKTVPTKVEIPVSLYRKLKERAAAHGRSVEDLILADIGISILRRKRSRGKKAHFPLIFSKGPKVDLTNEQIYER